MKIMASLAAILLLSLSAQAEVRVLLPVYLPETAGAYGATFLTLLTVRNSGQNLVVLRGIGQLCTTSSCPENQPNMLVHPSVTATGADISFGVGGNPGRVVIMDEGANVEFSLRVADKQQLFETLGTEVPVVPEARFLNEPFNLIGVPWTPYFRRALRVFAFSDTRVRVRVYEINSLGDVLLSEESVMATGAGALPPRFASPDWPDDVLVPAVGERFNIAPRETDTISELRIEIVPTDVPVWAMLSMTNNETQAITVISPSKNR